MTHKIDRRTFLKAAGLAGLALGESQLAVTSQAVPAAAARILPLRRREIPGARVAFVKTQDHAAGVRRALDLLDLNPVQGKRLFVKPNFNSAHAFPGSTHPAALRALIERLNAMGADGITLGDRSGMGVAHQIMQTMGVYQMADELGFETLPFETLADSDWELLQPEASHWQHGFAMARRILEADGVVQTCCLKTHGYGGHITLSLKNSVGMVAKTLPVGSRRYDFMDELHHSPDQRRMIAEINLAYEPDLIVLDGVQAFTTGGPHAGTLVDSQVILAGTDRVAIDAVGTAILRYFGTTAEVRQGAIFENEQIARAVELGLGVDRPEKIEFVTGDAESAAYAEAIRAILLEPGMLP